MSQRFSLNVNGKNEVKFDCTAVTKHRLDHLSDPRHDRGARVNRRRSHQPPRCCSERPGEPSVRPVAAAIANAIFDATGVTHSPGAVLTRPREERPVIISRFEQNTSTKEERNGQPHDQWKTI
jgi:hypothetical protein